MPRKAKKNAQGAGTIRKRSDGRWEARYTVGFDPATGKQKQKSIYGKTQREVRERLAEITTELDDGTYIEPSKMTLEAWMTVWLEDYMFDKKWSTIKHYKAQAKAHILPALGNVPLSQLDPHRIQSFYNSLLRGNGGKQPLSPKSVRNVHGILSKCLSTAVKLEYLRRNPAEVVTLPRVERKDIQPLTDAQVGALVAAIGSDGYGTLLKVVVFTGLRLAEAIGLTWDCVNFEKRRLTITNSCKSGPWLKEASPSPRSKMTRPVLLLLLQPRLFWSFCGGGGKLRQRIGSKRVGNGRAGKTKRTARLRSSLPPLLEPTSILIPSTSTSKSCRRNRRAQCPGARSSSHLCGFIAAKWR